MRSVPANNESKRLLSDVCFFFFPLHTDSSSAFLPVHVRANEIKITFESHVPFLQGAMGLLFNS